MGHLLKICCDIHRDLYRPQTWDQAVSVRSRLLGTFRGLEQALRWALKECPHDSWSSASTWREIDNEAAELLRWGETYAMLSTVHTAWSRGELSANLDEIRKRIIFSFKDSFDGALLESQIFSETVWAGHLEDGVLLAYIEPIFNEWIHEVNVQERSFPAPTIPSDTLTQIAKIMGSKICPGVPDEEILFGKTTLASIRKFFAASLTYSHCIKMLEDRHDSLYGAENDMGSLVMQGQKNEMLQFFADFTGVQVESVAEIVSLLTFDPHRPRSAINSHPFIETSNGSLALSSRFFCIVDPQQMVVGALIQNNERAYDRIVEMMQNHYAELIAERLRQRGFSVLREKALTDSHKETICPDFIVTDSQSGHLLIIEYKHAAQPAGPAEVSNKIKEYRKWIEQAARYKNFFCRSHAEMSAVLQTSIAPDKVASAVLFYRPIPIPVVSSADVIVADTILLEHLLQSRSWLQLKDLIQGLSDSWKHSLPNTGRYQTINIETHVGEWTYVRPALALASGEPVGPVEE